MGTLRLNVAQGATKVIQVTYRDGSGNPVDLTGWQGRGQIRFRAFDPEPIASFVVDVVDPAAGKVEITLPATALESVPLQGRNFSETTEAAYDIELFKDGDVIRLLQGICIISPEVTR